MDEAACGHDDTANDNYVAEMAAELDAMRHAQLAGHRRIVLVCDATSPVSSMRPCVLSRGGQVDWERIPLRFQRRMMKTSIGPD